MRRIALIATALAAAAAFALPVAAQTVAPAPTPMAQRPSGGASGPTVTSSYPTPLPALQGVRLQPVTVVTMPDFGSRSGRMTRSARKALQTMSGQLGEATQIAGTAQQVYLATSRLYQQRSAESQRILATDRSLQSVRLRLTNRN